MKFIEELFSPQNSSQFGIATLRLTLWYLTILMVISLFFSVALYQTSDQALTDSIRSQTVRIKELPFAGTMVVDLRVELEQARHTLLMNLIVQNIMVLVAGGAVSFFFARRTLRPIEQAMITQARFTADASHELRTPLTAMKSEIEVALRDRKTTSKEMREVLESNLEEIDKLEALSTSLLQLARYDEGAQAPIFKKVALQPLVERTVQRFIPRAEQQNSILNTKLREVYAEIDAASIQELLGILLDNALKYSQGTGKITVSLRAERSLAIISVSDTGIGIKAQDIPHLFERFYRADASRSEQHVSGHGLGLAIAKSIVDRHHGEIAVQSKPRKGTIFIVSLPLHQKRTQLLA